MQQSSTLGKYLFKLLKKKKIENEGDGEKQIAKKIIIIISTTLTLLNII